MKKFDAAIIVAGDVLIDQWVSIGEPSREDSATGAPIYPTRQRTKSLGGAGAVACMVGALEQVPLLFGRLPDFNCDAAYRLAACRVTFAGIVGPAVPATPVKTRIYGSTFGLVRIDEEVIRSLEPNEAEDALRSLRQVNAGWCVVADYNKGMVTQTIAEGLVKRFGENLIVDPGASLPSEWKGAGVLKMNTRQARGRSPRALADLYGFRRVVVTHGEEGCEYWADGTGELIPGVKVEAVDPTGCGDQFLAALGVALRENAPFDTACRFANLCAAKQAERPAILPVGRTDVPSWESLDDRGYEGSREALGT